MMSPVHVANSETRAQLEELASKYPRSSYTPYALFALARVHLKGIGTAPKVADDDLRAAYTTLEALKDVEFPYQPNVLAALYRCAKRIRPDSADGVKIHMIGAYPDADETLETLAPEVTAEYWASFRGARDGALYPVADEPNLQRVLVIGDDVSVAYTYWLRRSLKGKANLHRVPESAGASADALTKSATAKEKTSSDTPTKLDSWLGDKKWDVIVFNFGMDDLRRTAGRPRTTVEQYEKNLRTIAARLKATGATVIWASTTPVPDGAPVAYRAADVAVYNAAATKIAEEFGFAVVDLHAVVAEKLKESKPGDLFRVNDTRPTLDGGRMMGELIAKEVEKRLAEQR